MASNICFFETGFTDDLKVSQKRVFKMNYKLVEHFCMMPVHLCPQTDKETCGPKSSVSFHTRILGEKRMEEHCVRVCDNEHCVVPILACCVVALLSGVLSVYVRRILT